MLTPVQRLQCETIRSAKNVYIIINPGEDNQTTLKFGELFTHNIKRLRHGIYLAVQDYFKNLNRDNLQRKRQEDK